MTLHDSNTDLVAKVAKGGNVFYMLERRKPDDTVEQLGFIQEESIESAAQKINKRILFPVPPSSPVTYAQLSDGYYLTEMQEIHGPEDIPES